MKIKTDKTIDMTKGPLLPAMAAFALPMILSNLLQIAFNAADTVVVGQFVGQDALAAVGATTPIVNLLVGFFLGLSTGANIVIAMQIGKKEAGRISLSVHTSVFTALTGGVILTIFGFAASPLLLNLCGTPQNIIGQSILYLRIYFAGSVPLLVYNFGAAILRAGGDTVSPTIYMTISGTLNAALNLFFVLQLHMGVEGVAIATVISESVSAVLVMRELMRRRDAAQFMWSKLRADRALLGQILLIGVPTGLQSTMWALSNMAVQTSINSFGSTAVAGNSAAYTLETFLYTAMQAFTQACITFTSQCAGARNVKRIRQILVRSMALQFTVTFALGALVSGFGPVFLRLFTADSDVIRDGLIRLHIVVFWLWLNAVLDIPGGSMRGMGHGNIPTITMLLGIVGVRLLYIATIWRMHPTLTTLYLCFPISWVITLACFIPLWIYVFRKFSAVKPA